MVVVVVEAVVTKRDIEEEGRPYLGCADVKFLRLLFAVIIL